MASDQDVAHSDSISNSLARPSRDNEDLGAWYQYEPLQSESHIRVLKIEPGGEDDPLRCSLVQVSLDDELDFPALSYAWGDANDLRRIQCDGKATEITRNLYDALKMMRLRDIRILWADALCINQKDLVERGVQVQLMSRIYSQVDRVLLWLGREDQRIIDTALAYLGLFRSNEQKPLPLPNDDTEDALLSLFACPVFSRGWIIQEVALAKRIDMCWGYAILDLDSFSTSFSILPTLISVVVKKGKRYAFGLGALYTMADIRKYQQQGDTFWPLGLVKMTLFHQFSDERDRIYGMLALRIQGAEQLPSRVFVQADYTKDKWHAFQMFTEACLIREGFLATLLFINSGAVTVTDRPSWVPNWRDELLEWGDAVEGGMSCGDESLPVQKYNGGQITIRGFSVAIVESLLGGLTSGFTQTESQTLLRRMWSLFDSTCVANTALIANKFEDLFRKLVDDENYLCDLSDLLTTACREFLDLDLDEEPLPPFMQNPPEETSQIGRFYGRACIDWIRNKSFFRSAQGNLGLAPRDLQEGDTIAILFSSRGPNLSFALRPDGPFWKLVGPCYMHHLTDGSAVKNWKESGEPAESFIIS